MKDRKYKASALLFSSPVYYTFESEADSGQNQKGDDRRRHARNIRAFETEMPARQEINDCENRPEREYENPEL